MGISSTSIARKIGMALSGLFLVLFLGQHFTINFSSVVSPDTFNTWSHFMGTNGLVQGVLQPVLIAGIIFHFVMGIIIQLRNNSARKHGYKKYAGQANSSWASRNMIISGAVVLAFLGLHFYDFWIPEIVYKYVEANPEDPTRYFAELVHKFEDPIRVGIYVISFVLLGLHLWHGFASSLHTMGWNDKFGRAFKAFAKIFAVVIPLGFIFIALYHHFNQLPH